MSRYKYQGTMKDGNGRVIGSATTSDGKPGIISIFLAGTATSADAYIASSGGTAVNSVSTDEHGYFYFWVDDGDYGSTQQFKITCAHSDFRTQTYDDLIIFPGIGGSGTGDVSGPATNTDDYVPQWNGADSKLLKNGFAITATGKALIDDADAAAQRTTLGLGSVATRIVRDTLMVDDETVPDGDAIIAYGDANWSDFYSNLTSFVNQTAWRIFYSNTSGDVTELALGASGTYLKSNGAAAAPTFSTPSGAGNVVGPASATDLAITLFDGATGELIKNSLTTMDAAGAPTFPNDTAIRWKDAGGTSRNVLAYDSVDNIVVGVDGDDAKVYIERLNTSDAGNPLYSSRRFSLVANYWKTAAEHQRMCTIYHEMQSDAPKSTMHFDMGEDGAEVEAFALENDNGTILAIVKNLIKIEGGTPGANKVLTSDANGLASWVAPSGSSKWTDGGTYIYGTDEAGNTRLHDSGQLEIGATGGTSAPLIAADKWGFSSDVTEGGRRLLVLDGTEDHTLTPATWIEKLYSSNSDPGGDNSIPVCLYAAHKHSGSGVGYTHTIMAYALNSGTGDNDCIAISGRARKKGAGVGDSCGMWGSAYNDVNQNGGVMGLESSIYQNVAGMTANDRLGTKWSASLHVMGSSTGSPARAGIAIDAANTYRFWNAMIIDKDCFASAGAAGTVGINMGSFGTGNYPQYAIKVGQADTHLYCNSGNLTFYDPITGTKTLAELAAGGGSSKWTDAGTYIYPNNTGTDFRILDDDRIRHNIGSIDPFSVPNQYTPQTMGLATAGTYADSAGGNIFHLSSWVENTGSTPCVAVFGEGRSTANGAYGWGGNFVGISTASGATATGCEVNYAVMASGGSAYGIVIGSSGDYATGNAIQIQSNTLASIPANGISFQLGPSSHNPITNSLINTAAITSTFAFDLSQGTFTDCVMRVGSSTTPHLACTVGDLKFYDPVVGVTKTLTQLAAAGGGINHVVEDTTPKLGGNLDLNSHNVLGVGEILLNNNKAYLAKNYSGSNRVGLRLNTSNDWEIGLDGHMVVIGYGSSSSDPVMIRVGGMNNKQIFCDSPNTAGSGFRRLMVAN